MAVEVNTKQPNYQTNPRNASVNGEPPPTDPQYCECARIGKRSLSWAPWLGGLSRGTDGSLLNRRNLEVAHEHLYFEQSKDNIGFGPHGLFDENVQTEPYRWDERCYDGTSMRETLRTIGEVGAYNFLKNNCQDFMARVKERYDRLTNRE